MEEIDYKHSIELLNKDVDACLEIIDNWKKNCAYLVSIGVMPPDQWGVPLVEKLIPYERYDVVYHCNPATGDKILDRYILKNGYELYSIDFSCRSKNAPVLHSYAYGKSLYYGFNGIIIRFDVLFLVLGKELDEITHVHECHIQLIRRSGHYGMLAFYLGSHHLLFFAPCRRGIPPFFQHSHIRLVDVSGLTGDIDKGIVIGKGIQFHIRIFKCTSRLVEVV